MLPALPNRRKPDALSIATFAALILQFAALLWALWHGRRELQSLDVRDQAIEHIIQHVETEVDAATEHNARPGAKP